MDNDQLDELERRAMQWFRDADGYEYPIDGDNLLALITAARRPALPDREAVAKVIDPEAFKANTYVYDMYPIRRIDALAKADAILAMLSAAPKEGE